MPARARFMIAALTVVGACAPRQTARDSVVELDYADFGPPVMAHDVLGDEWYAWSQPGSFEPGDHFDVRVIVYEGDRGRTARAYPTVEGKVDRRLISRTAALAYLDASIADLAGEHDVPLVRLRQRLQATRARILTARHAARTANPRGAGA